jgi:hypothetical protein
MVLPIDSWIHGNRKKEEGWLQSKDVVDLRVSLLIHYMACTTPLFAFTWVVGKYYLLGSYRNWHDITL